MSVTKFTPDKTPWPSLQLFKDVPLEPIGRYLEQCQERYLTPGEVLLNPNHQNRHIYFILSGVLSVRLGAVDNPPLTSLGPGECVGEISLLDQALPSAYVVALEETRLMAMEDATLRMLIEASHGVARNLLYILCRRLRYSTVAIIHSDHNARIDALTGLPNRRGFDQTLKRQQQRCEKSGQPLCLIMADIDRFKGFNDHYGHLLGDKILRDVAQSINEHIRSNDTVARFGGEEFAVLLPETDLDTAVGIAERIRLGVEASVWRSEDTSYLPAVTVSLGVAQMSAGEPLKMLINDADAALYRAKQRGRNRVCR